MNKFVHVIHPCVDWKRKIRCVYVIRFGASYFYIGSTADLYTRIRTHVNEMARGYNKRFVKASKLMWDQMKRYRENHPTLTIRVEILELIDNDADLLKAEYRHINNSKARGRLNVKT